MDKICGIYCIENLINGKKYIGLSKDCLKRWSDHYSKCYHTTKPDEIRKPLCMAMKKYGRENFSFKIIEECSENELKEKEIYWISYYDSYNKGYNATKGGDLSDGRNTPRAEAHPCAKMTNEEVKQCRIWYSEGKRSRDIYEKYFKDKGILYSTFQKMWHGTTWKSIMPEVFKHNPHPRQKITKELVIFMKQQFALGKSCADVYHLLDEKISRTTINDIYNGRRYKDIMISDVSTIPVEGSSFTIDT